MTISTLPTFSLSATATETTTPTEKNITLGTSALKGGQASNVYFGNYQQSSLGNTPPTDGAEDVDWIYSETAKSNDQGQYYSKDPIKWRVLANNNDYDSSNTTTESGLFMVSDQNLDVFVYHEELEAVTWATSTMRSWLNGLAENEGNGGDAIDYTAKQLMISTQR